MCYDWETTEEKSARKRSRPWLYGGLVMVVAFLSIIGFWLSALADSAKIEFPDGTKDCTFQALTISPSNATLTVSGCYLGGPPTQAPPPPVSGDPGSGVWVTPTGVTVFDMSSSSNRTFVPGCIDGRDFLTTNCEYDGGMISGKVYAARVEVGRGGHRKLKFDRAEAGEANGGSGVWGALSTIPGDLQTAQPSCQFTEIAPYIEVSDPSYADALVANDVCGLFSLSLPESCKPAPLPCVIQPDTRHYLNFTPTLSGCGKGNECRVQLIEN